ncbi:hypothetical protein M1506_03450 [Patescibacteria group bacterium]|nr:hypothetical protein [Patescibacteria group bacterium]
MDNQISKNYLEELKKRKKESHVHKKYQMIGLMLSEILEDDKHKALYIKLAKERDEEELLTLAKSIAEKKDVNSKGAYFMRVLFDGDKNKKAKK